MPGRMLWPLLLAALFLVRLGHRGILWVEEAYPAAAAIQMLDGRLPYRDFFFDKPPLSAVLYLLWGAWPGWPQRLAGALYVLLCAWLAARIAARWWGPRESLLAALLTAFFLTFDTHAAVMALAPDLLAIAPSLAAVWLASTARPLAAGLCAALALWTSGKAALILPVCLLWGGAPRLIAGFALGVAPVVVFLHFAGALAQHWQQVWIWGRAYARDTFLASPWREGAVRTAAWIGFHAAAVLPAAWMWWKQPRDPLSARLAAWSLLALVSVALGLRFAPRYYFALLPVVILAGSRGLSLMPPRIRTTALLLLAIPALRFGPRFWNTSDWADTAMNRDSAEAARIVNSQARPGDTILVWGYRPDILVYTRLPLGAPYLDAQPLTGVLADRHLVSSRPTFPALAAAHRALLVRLRPAFVIDGLGPYNPDLDIRRFPDLDDWLGRYVLLAETRGCRIYRRNPVALAFTPEAAAASSPPVRESAILRSWPGSR